MRRVPNLRVERYRVRDGLLASTPAEGNNGLFMIPTPAILAVIVSDGGGWDHVSVSRPNRTPTWEEMAIVKNLFFRDDETVIQFHPPKKNYVNRHPYCLHLWRPQQTAVPLPPSWMVGPLDGETDEEAFLAAHRALEDKR